MRTLCFLWLIIFPTLFAESFCQEKKDVIRTIQLLRKLGPKTCLKEVENVTSVRFTSLPKKRDEIHQGLKISFNFTFELFKKNVTSCQWDNNAFRELMGHLQHQNKANIVPVVSSKLEPLVQNFKQLDGFLTQQNFSRCACEIARQDILNVMHHFRVMMGHRN